MKKLIMASAISSIYAPVMASPAAAELPYKGSRFSEVWQTVEQGTYQQLPEFKVTTASFFGFLKDKLGSSAARTLSDRSDVLPSFKKLLHPNGICLKGTWNITEATEYTGYFREGSKAVFIGRASSALSDVNSGQKRSLGIAGKLFPTDDEDHKKPLPTANFFVIDSLAGTYTANFRDTVLTNDISNLNLGLDNASQALVAAAAARAIAVAEFASGGKDPSVRQLYPISELGESNPKDAITPRWLKLQGRPGQRDFFSDFRDELRVENNGGTLVFDIFVASDGERGGEKPWNKIGYIEFTDSVSSEGCDSRLHFAHPRWRSDLKFAP